uniref:Uncharacterized protein n=1 Tax=viral metagenome TaxID=1070528 RepID=A0A6C0JDM2_9ZZZZ
MENNDDKDKTFTNQEKSPIFRQSFFHSGYIQ